MEKKREEIFFFEREDLAHFLKLTQTNGLEMGNLVFTVLAYTGLRIGELLALNWTDFYDELGSIRITKTLYNSNNHIKKYQLLTPKTKGSVRTIRIDEIFVGLLRK
ncbi:site-specific integrase [Bacillus mojavensis]|uniref:hypothetical protein n=1 Tax=Bacillus mojavensis TaxID=72360 RepID=UPI002DB88EFB|nr:hypothetical protein [Bacillus mojavensis]MEC1669822.1 hypothetical protein [Bacillus mojavensis]